MPVTQKAYRENYLHFKLTSENCGEEPINRPYVIHNHGAIIAWDSKKPDIPVFMSENIIDVFDEIKLEDLWTKSPADWMGEELYGIYAEMDDPFTWDSIDPIPIMIHNKSWNVIRHIFNNTRFIEFEPVKSDENLFGRKLSSFHEIRMVTEPFQYIKELSELLDVFAKKYRKVTGYDRVMVYRFDDDFHGSIVGESKKEALEPFFGLHYPASDIPPLARALFLKNRSRIIPDVHADLSKLTFNPNKEDSHHHLDLSCTQLRGTSPIHIEYLKNMGVGATYTSALIINNKLWGLIACHHYSPFFINYETRKTGELIADNLCRRISEILFEEEQTKRERLRKKEENFNNDLVSSWEVVLQLINNKIDLIDLLETDGAAVVTSSIGVHIQGNTPGKDTLLKIYKWLEQHSEVFEDDICLTTDLREILKNDPEFIDLPEDIGGAAIIRLIELDNCMLMWFNKSQRAMYDWAGDPNQPYEIDYNKDGSIRLSPRKSFERWKKMVNYKSIPWDKVSTEMLLRIKDVILKKNRDWNPFKSEHYKRELQQITYTASHDLQEPLRTIDNYLMLLSDELEDKNEVFVDYLSKTRNSAKRMKELVNQMLIYSKIGSSEFRTNVDLNKIVKQVEEDLSLKIQELGATIFYQELPIIYANEISIKQLIQNLISNALKYRKEDIPIFVEIGAKQTDAGWVFSVKDNGIGIEKKSFEKIFSLFQRLHHQDSIPGTGIGLSICRKIVESMGGKMWVTSEIGKGSTFWFSLKSKEVNNKLI